MLNCLFGFLQLLSLPNRKYERCQYCRIQNPLWLPVLLAWEVHKYYTNNPTYPSGYIVLPLTGNEKYFLVKGLSITLSQTLVFNFNYSQCKHAGFDTYQLKQTTKPWKQYSFQKEVIKVLIPQRLLCMLNLLEIHRWNEAEDMHMVLRSGIKKEEVLHFVDTELKQEPRIANELIQTSGHNPYLQRWCLSPAACLTYYHPSS